MKVELNYKDNRVILTLNDVGAVFADDTLEGDRLGPFQVISKEVQIDKGSE